MFGGISQQKHLRLDIISIDDDEKTCNVELWKNEFYSYGRDSIIPVQNILCRFVPVKCKFLIVKMQLIANSIFVKKIVIKTFKICIIKNSYSKFVLLKLSCYKICIKIFNMLLK